MKYYFLFNTFVPAVKCGAVAEGLGTVTGMLGQTYQVRSAQENVSAQLAAQRQENQLNRDWQTEQAEIARNWQAGQTLQQNQFQSQLAAQQQSYNLQSMKQQALYNSPVYQRRQLENANLNPQVYFGSQSSFGGSSAVAGGSPSAPSHGSSPSVGSVQGLSPVGFQPNILNPAQLFQGVAEGLKALGEAKKSGIETKFLEDSFEARLRELIAKGDMAQTVKALQELDLKFQQSNFPIRLKKAYSDYKETLSNINLLDNKALTEKEQQSLHRSTVALNSAIQALNDKEKERLGILIQYLPSTLESEINRNKAQASQSYASAQESQASTENIRIWNKIQGDERYRHSIISQAVTAGQQAIDQNKLTKNQVQHLNYMIEQAAYANDMKEFTYWSGQIQSYMSSVGQAASAFYGAGALRELIRMRKLSALPPTPVKGFTP